jgi:glutamate racemase
MIALFDSGMGGLSVLRAVRARLPHHDLFYLADSAYCPYGPLPPERVRARACACTRWLIEQGAQLVVVACNTATAAAVDLLRSEFNVPIVGMEPGVKPAVAASRRGRVGVLATSGTLESDRFAGLLARYAGYVSVTTVAAPDLVDLVETGHMDSLEAQIAVQAHVEHLIEQEVDVIVLGCTHFPFLRPLLDRAIGSAITIIDTGPAVAVQVMRVATTYAIEPGNARLVCATTGSPAQVAPVLARMWGHAPALSFADC